MARSRFSFIAALSLCVAWLVALPSRAVALAIDFVDAVLVSLSPRAVLELLRLDGPALAFDGPGDRSISPALANEQRHEAGLAKLGAVRHR